MSKLPDPKSLRRRGKRLPPVEPIVQELLWAIVKAHGGTIAGHIKKAIVMYSKNLDSSCTWTFKALYDDRWETDCGHSFVLNSDTPYANDLKFCGFCGRKLVEAIYTDEEEDDVDDRF